MSGDLGRAREYLATGARAAGFAVDRAGRDEVHVDGVRRAIAAARAALARADQHLLMHLADTDEVAS